MTSRPPFVSKILVRSLRTSIERRPAGLAISVFALLLSGCGGSTAAPAKTSGSAPVTTATSTTLSVALTASKAAWQLRNPLSRMVLLPAGGNQLAILGGLTAADTSASGIFRVNLGTGALSAVGALPAPVHDAAGVQIGSNDLILGGGSASTVASVESAPASGGNGKTIGRLPRPRSDCTGIVVGGEAVVVGGYDGSAADPSVLATNDGKTFKKISTLKIPVRYAALSSAGGSVYVFGGMAVGGTGSGQPTDSVQKIDLQTGVTTVVGPLPLALEGAMAFVLNGHIYLAGGDTGSSAHPISNSKVWEYDPGTGFTQAGLLPVPVAYAGVATSGGEAWIVGGEQNGKTTAVVQALKA